MILDSNIKELQDFINKSNLLMLEDIEDIINWNDKFSEYLLEFIDYKDFLFKKAAQIYYTHNLKKSDESKILEYLNNEIFSEISDVPNVINIEYFIDTNEYELIYLFVNNKDKKAVIYLQSLPFRDIFELSLNNIEFDCFIKS
jgi:hypothetical protein